MLNTRLSDYLQVALTVPLETSIQAVAERMTATRSRAALVTDPQGQLCGIVTDLDLRARVLAVGRNPADPVSTVMVPEPLVLPAGSTVSQALLTAARQRVRHVLVRDDSGALGLVSVFDLLRQYDYNAAWLLGDIHVAADTGELVRLSNHLPRVLVALVQNSVPAADIGQTISLVGQEIVHRLLTLAEARWGEPPVPYAYVVAGSMGRLEQTAYSDQDTGMVLADTFVPALHDVYFQQVAQFVSDGMDACGYRYCSGDIMATNPRWRQPLSVWQGYFRGWIETPEPQALLNAAIFFDLRCVYGEESLFNALQQDLLQRTQATSLFQRLLAENARSFQPPLGWLRRFVLASSPVGTKALDMKRRGVVPVIDLARVYALAHGLPQQNTFARLEAMIAAGVLNAADGEDLQDAFEFISQARLQHQARQIQRGIAPDNYMPPGSLSALERRHLKDVFAVVGGLQEGMWRRFGSSA